jgi:hypothetical protein
MTKFVGFVHSLVLLKEHNISENGAVAVLRCKVGKHLFSWAQ